MRQIAHLNPPSSSGVFSATYPSPLGQITLESDGKSLCGLYFGECESRAKINNQAALKATAKPSQTAPNPAESTTVNLPIFLATKAWLDDYFARKNPPISRLALAPRGSDFSRLVWEMLCEIPFGATTTYGELAQKIARQNATKMSAQAIGGALSRNPIAIIIPCHRVVMKSGALGGYACGVHLKQQLLEFEGLKR